MLSHFSIRMAVVHIIFLRTTSSSHLIDANGSGGICEEPTKSSLITFLIKTSKQHAENLCARFLKPSYKFRGFFKVAFSLAVAARNADERNLFI